ncbi:MAG: transposase [Clostridia bacterium]|nr:transposase [Clostridia bacterium]
MAKITNKERIEIWEKKKAGKGVAELSREYGLDKSTVKYLFRLLEKHGPGMLRQEKNRTYSKEIKLEIVNRVLQDGMSKESTAILLNQTRKCDDNDCD